MTTTKYRQGTHFIKYVFVGWPVNSNLKSGVETSVCTVTTSRPARIFPGRAHSRLLPLPTTETPVPSKFGRHILEGDAEEMPTRARERTVRNMGGIDGRLEDNDKMGAVLYGCSIDSASPAVARLVANRAGLA